MKYSEIGSNFWLAPETKFVVEELDNEDFGLPEGDMAFTSTGRGAILLAIAHMKQQRKVALLPSFTCSSVILPFVENGYQVDYYDIEKDLTISKERFLEKAEKMQPSVILVQNYYGFDTLTPMKEVFGNLQKQGVVIIEDVTHSLYSGIPRLTADYYVTSLRKWFGIPEGGMALSQKGPFQAKPTDSDGDLERAKLDCVVREIPLYHGKASVKSRKFWVNAAMLKRCWKIKAEYMAWVIAQKRFWPMWM